MHAHLLLALALGPVQGFSQRPAPPQQSRSDLAPVPLDCNANGIDDDLDVQTGLSTDCNGNGIPDECDAGAVLLIEESFEHGQPQGWSFGGLFHVTDQCALSACDGSKFAYMGLDLTCNFDVGFVSGGLGLPQVHLPQAATRIELSYCSIFEGEGIEKYDKADVLVNGDLVDHVSPLPQLDWESRSIDLTAYRGQSVDISFAFDSIDIMGNAFLGWQIDNVRLVAYGLDGRAFDCDLNGVPDGCQPDCDANGVIDACEIAADAGEDCNLNGIPDGCDLASGFSQDCNLNGVPDACDLSIHLRQSAANLAASHPAITELFPGPYLFERSPTTRCLTWPNDESFFFCSNVLATDLDATIDYTGGVPVQSAAFGPDGKYYTAQVPGLFALVAADCDIETFSISGAITMDNTATVDALQLSTTVDGQLYTIYVRRVHSGSSPSLNQIMAIPGDGTGVTHTWSASPVVTEQSLSGLTATDRIVYALVSRDLVPGEGGPPLRPVDAREIVREILLGTPGPGSLDLDGNGVPDECD